MGFTLVYINKASSVRLSKLVVITILCHFFAKTCAKTEYPQLGSLPSINVSRVEKAFLGSHSNFFS